MALLESIIIDPSGSLQLLNTTENTSTEGNIWFDISSQRLKYSWFGGIWSTGEALLTGRDSLAGAGTQNEALAFSGNNPNELCTEEYNGTSWSIGGALSTGTYRLAGAGTQNAGLAFGGFPGFPCTEEYNGSSWSAGRALINGRHCLAGAGTQNAALAFGGGSGYCTEEYNPGVVICSL
jgi:hypothetical protein